MAPKVLVTRVLPPKTQERLLQQDFELIQWEEDCSIPREVLLEKVKGTICSQTFFCFVLLTFVY